MKNLRLIGFGTGSLLVIAGVLFACGDDTVVSVDAGTDAATDAPAVIDGSVIPDGGFDVVTVDAGDAGGPLTVAEFTTRFAETFCKSLARCCFGSANTAGDAGVIGNNDAGRYDQAACLGTYRAAGFESSFAGLSPDGGAKVALDPAKALECLQKAEAASCNMTGAEFQATRAACFQAVKGTVTAGGACVGSIDCAPGNFCNPSAAGGAKCEALRPADGGCGDVSSDPVVADQACSWRSSGDTARHCEVYDFLGGNDIAQADWKCKAAYPNTSDCANSAWCAAGICSSETFTCESPSVLFNSGSCGQFVAR